MNGQAKHTSDSQGISMDITAMLAGSGLSLGAGILAKALGFWRDSGITEKQLEERLAFMKEEMKQSAQVLEKTKTEFDSDMKLTIAELRAVVLTVAKLQSSQDVTNMMMMRSIEALLKKSEAHDDRITDTAHKFAEIHTTQGLIREILDELKKPKV